jgi:hypothetical protein
MNSELMKKIAVIEALQKFIARRRRKRLLKLFGQFEWDEAYHYKAERSRK